MLVPQLPAPLPGTVAENVRYGPSLIDREVEVEPLLERAGLEGSYAERDASLRCRWPRMSEFWRLSAQPRICREIDSQRGSKSEIRDFKSEI